MRTIPGFEEYLDPIEDILSDSFIPTLFGQERPFPDDIRKLMTLTPNQGGLGIISPKSETQVQYNNSKLITKHQSEAIKSQRNVFVTNETSIAETKKYIQETKTTSLKSKINSIDSSLQPNVKRMVEQARDKGAALGLMPFHWRSKD